MTIRGLFLLCSGLFLFLLGMKALSAPLRSMADTRLLARLSGAASHPIRGLCCGALVTALLQSSSALTVFLVGLTGAGALSLESAAVLLMGANVGTTLSPWLLGLWGLSHRQFFLRPEFLCPLLMLLSFGTYHSKRRPLLSRGLMGLGLLLLGMDLMQRAAGFLPQLAQMVPSTAHPLRGVLAGTVATGILQSSAGAIGLLQAMCTSGVWTLAQVLPLLIGLNLGTCVTALLSSLGAGHDARRVAVIHISFNAIGGIAWLIILSVCADSEILCQPAVPASVAALHSLFNLSTATVLLPLRKYLVWLSIRLVPPHPPLLCSHEQR